MPGLIKLLATATLVLALTGSPQAANTDIHINPMPPHFQPTWVPLPKPPGVEWSPQLPTDVFRYKGKYYFFWEGFLYRGNKPSGPWKAMTKLPAWFSEIDKSYFKTLNRKTVGPPPGGPGLPQPGQLRTPTAPAPPLPATGMPAPPPGTVLVTPPGAAAPPAPAVLAPPATPPATPTPAPAPPQATPPAAPAAPSPAPEKEGAPAAPAGTPKAPKVM